MSDGTITVNPQDGQPHIFLYTNLNGTPSDDPQSGQIRFRNVSTIRDHVYVSDTTADSINIDVFLDEISNISILYLQDKHSSVIWVRKTVQGVTIYPAYVDVNVTYLSSSGLGSSDFGVGHPILPMFDNSFLISNRITTLETKTEHQSANSLETRFNGPINIYDHKIYNYSDPIDLNDVSNKNILQYRQLI